MRAGFGNMAAIVLLLLCVGQSCAQPPAARDADELPQEAVARLGSGNAPPEMRSGHTGTVVWLKFTPDGRRLVSRGTRTARVWDVSSGSEVFKFPAISAAALSPDGARLLTSRLDAKDQASQCVLWDMQTGDQTGEVIAGGASLARFSQDGRRLAILVDGRTTLYDLPQGIKSKVVAMRISEPLGFSPDGRSLACAVSYYDSRIRLIELETPKEVQRFLGMKSRPLACAFSRDGGTLACGGNDNVIHIWETATGAALHPRPLKGHEEGIQSLAFSPDGRLLASASFDGTVRVWEVATGEELAKLTGHTAEATAVAFSPSGAMLASGSRDKTILLWDVLRVIIDPAEPSEPLTEQQLEKLWRDLASLSDARGAYAAIGRMLSDPEQALPYLRRQVETVINPSGQDRVAELIRNLGDPRYLVRERATSELIKQVSVARAQLEKALTTTNSAEVRFRIRRILEQDGQQPLLSKADLVRMQRVVLYLQRQKSPAAKELLGLLAKQFPSQEIAKSAQDALNNLGG